MHWCVCHRCTVDNATWKSTIENIFAIASRLAGYRYSAPVKEKKMRKEEARKRCNQLSLLFDEER
jgi:hypothetical protein